jgi:putative ABC transport system permease protein
MRSRRTLGDIILKSLLRLLPAEFRGDFGRAMEADLDERRDHKGRSGTWRREVPALLALAVREHASVLRDDIRYAIRLMARTPAVTALAVATLAMGTGASVAMFTVIDAVMLRSPFVEPERIAIVLVNGSEGRITAGVPAEQYHALVAEPRTLSSVAALGGGSHLLTGSGEPRRQTLNV